MKVTHHGDQHLLCVSSEEVGYLVDLCHAGAFPTISPARGPEGAGWRPSWGMCGRP